MEATRFSERLYELYNYTVTVHTRPESLLAEVFLFRKKMGFCLLLHLVAVCLTTLTTTWIIKRQVSGRMNIEQRLAKDVVLEGTMCV